MIVHNYNFLFQNPGHQRVVYFPVLCMSNNFEMYSKYYKYSIIKTLDSVLSPQKAKLFLFALGGI